MDSRKCQTATATPAKPGVLPCGNSTVSRYTVLSYTITTQISTHVLNNIKVPQFDPEDAAHSAVVEVAKKCVKAASDGESVTLSKLDVELVVSATQMVIY